MKTSVERSDKVREYVRTRYGAIAEQSGADCGCAPTCCTSGRARSDALTEGNHANEPNAGASAVSCCDGADRDQISYGEKLGYSAEQLATAPAGADLGLGCGNPLAIASIRPGEVVLDLGSGAGFDCFLAARQLAGTGKVIGVDMTPAMVSIARSLLAGRADRPEYRNIEFRLGEIEALPVADATVDLIISNCVINLSPEKERVMREAFRVLKPGGRLALADVVATQPLPATLQKKLSVIGACVGGATHVGELRRMLTDVGFERVQIAVRESSRAMINQWTEDENAGEFVVSGLITAFKPMN